MASNLFREAIIGIPTDPTKEPETLASVIAIEDLDDRKAETTALAALQTEVDALQGAVVSGLIRKDPVAAWAGTNITLSGAQTVDGVTLSNGDRVGVGGQTDATQNGVWVYNDAGAWTRATDMDESAEIDLSAVLVEDGATYGGGVWQFQVADPGTFVLDTDDIAAVKVDDAGAIKDYLDAQVALKADQTEVDALTATVALKANSADLGTASASDVGDFATAAQGVTADSAVQPEELATKLLIGSTGEWAELTDAVGSVAAEFGIAGYRSPEIELTQDKLWAGSLEIVPDAGANALEIQDRYGNAFRIPSHRDIVDESEVSGIFLGDSLGNLIEIEQPAEFDLKEAIPPHSYGYSLYNFRSKIAAMKASNNAGGGIYSAKIATFGDSWVEQTPISGELRDLFSDRFTMGGSGYIGFGQNQPFLGGVTLSLSGFVKHDITSELGAPSGPYGLSGDWIEATGTTETAAVAGIVAGTIHIYYEDADGSFRYRVDGGVWTTVTGGNTGAASKVTVSGLSTSGTHTLDIDTTVNAGTVKISNLLATGKTGIEFSKIGNGGLTAPDVLNYIESDICALTLADMGLEAVIVVLGTNDVSANIYPGDHRAALETIIDSFQAAKASASVILAASPESSRTGLYEFADYRKQTLDIYRDREQVEFANLLDYLGPFDVTWNESPKIWADNSHLNIYGGRGVANFLYNSFFNIL